MNASTPPFRRSVLATLAAQPADALLAIIKQFEADPRGDKIDLGVGVYRDEQGNCPIPSTIKDAERRLLAGQTSKGYLGSDGDIVFVELLARLVLGPEGELGDQLIGLQTPGGGGALRLAADLYRAANSDGRVWIGNPTWPNHQAIFAAANVPVVEHPFYDAATGALRFDAMMTALEATAAGDALLLHGCCHNPTGAQLDEAQWQAVIELIARRGLLPIVDLAYHGLGDGLEGDAAATQAIFAAVPEAMLAYSCDKNFALYRDRVGALLLKGATAAVAEIARGNLLSLARTAWSMPPDHGAAVVRIILDDPMLADAWRAELEQMRLRLNAVRAALADAHPRLEMIGEQRGMFAMLPLSAADVAEARERHGIYMAGNGRINIAGLRVDQVARFVSSIRPALERQETPVDARR